MRLAARIGTLGAALLALVGAGTQAQAGTVVAGEAPAAWVAYAQRVSQQFQVALAGDSAPAQRFNAWVDQLATARMDAAQKGADPQAGSSAEAVPGPDVADPPTFRVRVWLDRAGTITRVEPEGVDDDRAAADLCAVLMAQAIGMRPPRGMKQPVIVRLAPGARL